MSPPAIEHRVVRRDGERARERLHRLAHLPSSRLCDAKRDEALDVPRLGRERLLRTTHRARINLRVIGHTRRRRVLHRL
jgi:hypothetical protein